MDRTASEVLMMGAIIAVSLCERKFQRDGSSVFAVSLSSAEGRWVGGILRCVAFAVYLKRRDTARPARTWGCRSQKELGVARQPGSEDRSDPPASWEGLTDKGGAEEWEPLR